MISLIRLCVIIIEAIRDISNANAVIFFLLFCLRYALGYNVQSCEDSCFILFIVVKNVALIAILGSCS